jgi:transcriptional regulator of acetoin/glycerol metabolism
MSLFRSGNPELSAAMLGPWGQAHLRVKKALKEAQGNIQEAARALNVSDRTIYRWLRAHPELEREVERMREQDV